MITLDPVRKRLVLFIVSFMKLVCIARMHTTSISRQINVAELWVLSQPLPYSIRSPYALRRTRETDRSVTSQVKPGLVNYKVHIQHTTHITTGTSEHRSDRLGCVAHYIYPLHRLPTIYIPIALTRFNVP